MIKVLIVEDKPPILWSIREMVQNYSPEIKIIGEALNGQEALSIIDQQKPDIVLTDIKMPIIDGLMLIREAQKKYPDLIFVIISGYDEFEYARQAMKLGVSEYLLKPVSDEAICETFDKITVDFKKEVYDSKKNLLQNIINSGLKSTEIMNHEFDCQFFVAMVLCAGSFSSHINIYSNPHNYFWESINYSYIISAHLPPSVFFWCFEGKNPNELVLLLGIPENIRLEIEQSARSILKDLSNNNVPVTISVSKKIKSVSEIGSETHLARLMLYKKLQFGKSGIIFCQKSSDTEAEVRVFLDSSIEKKVAAFIQLRQKDLFINEVKKMVNSWESSGYTQYVIEMLLKQIIRTCCKSCIDKPEFLIELEQEVDEAIIISKDYPTLLRSLDSIFTNFFINKSAESRGESAKEVIERVDNYLKLHMADPITLNSLSEMSGFDPSYLSRVFKKSKGASPMEYLTNLRIKKAKELITGTAELMLKDIAEIVGYSSPYYFSRIFKAVTGMTPSEYKRQT